MLSRNHDLFCKPPNDRVDVGRYGSRATSSQGVALHANGSVSSSCVAHFTKDGQFDFCSDYPTYSGRYTAIAASEIALCRRTLNLDLRESILRFVSCAV